MRRARPTLAEQTLEAAGIGGWELDVASGRLRWTRLTFRIHELDTAAEPPPAGALEFYAPEARPVIAAAAREAVRTGAPWDLELPLVTARGRRIWVRATGRALRAGGKTVKLFGAFEDVTARRETAERAERLSVIAEQTQNVAVLLDRDGRTEWVNAAFTRLTGYTIEDMRGRPPGEVLAGPETDPNTLRHVAGCIRDGVGFDVEILDYAKDGQTHWVAVIGSPVRNAAGALTGFISAKTEVTARRVAEQQARREAAERARAEQLLRDVLDALPSAVTAYDRDERFILANRAYEELFPVAARFARPGVTREEVVRLAAEHGQHADAGSTPEQRAAWIARSMAQHRAPGQVRTLRLADGRVVQARERVSDSGNVVSVRTDVTDLVRAEDTARREAAERERAEALLRDVLDVLPSGVLAYDRDERMTLVNRSYRELFPIAGPNAVPGRTLDEFIRLNVEAGQFPDAGTTPAERERWVADHVALHRAPGPARTLRLPDGRFMLARECRSESGNLVCVRTDTTDLMRAEADLRVQAERDPLTLLANRPAFLAALERALSPAAQGGRADGALLLLDIDYFKQINDTLGHDCGDTLLIEFAARLRTHMRASDVAARLGGDEFGVVMPGLTDAAPLAARMDAIHAALTSPVELGGRLLPIGVSVGVSVFPADGTDAAKLLKNADLALYEAKRNGRGRWCTFRPEQAVALERHVRMADALRGALAQQLVTVALQPKRKLRGGGHAGFEALARWHDGSRWVPPSEFVPVAEDTGLIAPLGRAVMETALARARAIRDQGFDPGRLAVNVTGHQLLEAQFIEQTLEAPRRHGLSPADLELEITETVLLSRAAERIEAVLREFSDLGITLALDDFGTGYASLAHLSRLPIDRLKIDRSFIDGIGMGGPGGVIARTVISLAHSLEMESIAEGVETQEQLAFLEAAGCDAAQGYLFARPLLTTAQAIDYLRAADLSAPGPRREVARAKPG
jgi:diguanylate cyclase (GGDEF)-like protein/PAS domain S-box-containing protein